MKQVVESMSEMWKRWEGQVVNNIFPLREYLGGSKHNAVFLTSHPEQKDQKIAIKLLSIDPRGADLQLSRWAMSAKLVHPHLLRLYQMGRCRLGDIPLLFLVMEYAEENLSQVLPHRALTPEEARDTLAPTLEALAFVHREGFAHGHLKPANIMAVKDQIKLTSDGLWWMGEPSVEVDNSGPYDPPEKSSTGISPAGDVWSLGITLVEALTQRRPVRDDSGEASIPVNLPPPFLEIARQCMRPEPQLRSTVSQIASQLEGSKPATKTSNLANWKNALASWKDLLSGWRNGFATQRLLLLAVMVALVVVAALMLRRFSKHPTEDTAKAPPAPVSQPVSQPTAEKPKAGINSATALKPSPATVPRASAPIMEPPQTLIASTNRGAVLHQVIPNVPQSARDTIQGTVRVNVRVGVDGGGNVSTAKFDSPGPSRYFARLAMQAAEGWKFTPPRTQGSLPQWILHFEFQRSGTRVRPLQVTR